MPAQLQLSPVAGSANCLGRLTAAACARVHCHLLCPNYTLLRGSQLCVAAAGSRCVCAYTAHNRHGSITGRPAPPGQPWVKAFNIFNALGSIAFAYNFTGVLMEIQVGANGAAASGLALRHTASCSHCMHTTAAAQTRHSLHSMLQCGHAVKARAVCVLTVSALMLFATVLCHAVRRTRCTSLPRLSST